MIRPGIAAPRGEAFPLKRESRDQSRRNSEKRQRMVAARHAQAGHWKPQARPMFNPGSGRYETGVNTGAMSMGGIAAVHRLPTKLGLGEAIDDRVKRLRCTCSATSRITC